MAISDGNPQQRRLPLGWSRALAIYLMFALAELLLLFFAGLAYFLLLFWLFHLAGTSTPIVPQFARLLSGSAAYERNRENLVRLRASRSYRVRWLVTNAAFLAIAVLSFRYNVRLWDILD